MTCRRGKSDTVESLNTLSTQHWDEMGWKAAFHTWLFRPLPSQPVVECQLLYFIWAGRKHREPVFPLQWHVFLTWSLLAHSKLQAPQIFALLKIMLLSGSVKGSFLCLKSNCFGFFLGLFDLLSVNFSRAKKNSVVFDCRTTHSNTCSCEMEMSGSH